MSKTEESTRRKSCANVKGIASCWQNFCPQTLHRLAHIFRTFRSPGSSPSPDSGNGGNDNGGNGGVGVGGVS